jgi:hypothetical protein
MKIHLLLMADGESTFVGLAADRDKLAKIMSGMKNGMKNGAPDLKSRNDIEQLRNERHVQAGVTSIAGLVGLSRWFIVERAMGPGDFRAVAELRELLERLPHKGRTPITAFGDVESGSEPRTAVRIHASPEALKDLGQLLMVLAR